MYKKIIVKGSDSTRKKPTRINNWLTSGGRSGTRRDTASTLKPISPMWIGLAGREVNGYGKKK